MSQGDPRDPEILHRVLKELDEVANEAARMERALELAREAELRPHLRDRRKGDRRGISERRAGDRRKG